MLTKTKKVTNLQTNFKSLIIAGFLASITLTPAADAMGILAKFANLATKFSQQKSLDKLAINKPAIFFAKNTPVNNSQIKILDFDYARDAKAIINLYEQNWNLLDEPELKELCSEIVNSKLKLVTKEKNPRHLYAGKLITKVLHYNNEPAGFAIYQEDFDDKGYIECLCIDKKFRSKNLGEKLQKYAMDDLLTKCSKVHIKIKKSNQKAIEFAKKTGFKQTGHNDELAFLSIDLHEKTKQDSEI